MLGKRGSSNIYSIADCCTTRPADISIVDMLSGLQHLVLLAGF